MSWRGDGCLASFGRGVGLGGWGLGVSWLGLSTVQFQAPIIQVFTYPQVSLISPAAFLGQGCLLSLG